MNQKGSRRMKKIVLFQNTGGNLVKFEPLKNIANRTFFHSGDAPKLLALNKALLRHWLRRSKYPNSWHQILFCTVNCTLSQANYLDNPLPDDKDAEPIWTPTIKFWTTKEDLTSVQLPADPFSRIYVNRSGSPLLASSQQIEQEDNDKKNCLLT